MAKLITPITEEMEPGEKRFAARLKDKLDDECLCWFNVPIKSFRDPNGRALCPDFILLDPKQGLWVLEVKDWSIDYIISCNKDVFRVGWDDVGEERANPQKQALTGAHVLADLLKSNKSLVNSKGKLPCPWTHGVVLTKITRKAFEENWLQKLIEDNHVICQDEMTENTPPSAFYQRLVKMMNGLWHLKESLSQKQIDLIRADIFPDIEIRSQRSFFEEGRLKELDLMHVMDLQQEQLARSLGGGHRIIHGVAGSGKTMILVYRAIYLAQVLNKPVLLLCYNWPVADYLKGLIKNKDVEGKIQVFHIHGWCRHLLKQNNLSQWVSDHDDHEAIVTKTINSVASGEISKGEYGAILLDEGHDFHAHPEWFGLVLDMLDPSTQASFLMAYDDAQSIYDEQKARSFSFKSVGINAQGRTSILRLNYRNTQEVLLFAKQFANDLLQERNASDDGIPHLRPESAGRHGPKPVMREGQSQQEEFDLIVQAVKQAHEDGVPWKQIAIIYYARWIGDEIAKSLKTEKIPYQQKRKGLSDFDLTHDSLKLMAMAACKGLEFQAVCIPKVGDLPSKNKKNDEEESKEKFRDKDQDKRLLYIAMTRSTERLMLTYQKQADGSLSPFVVKLLTALQALG